MDRFDHLFDHMDNVIKHAFDESGTRGYTDGTWQPSMDMYECTDRLVILVGLPGVRKKDIRLTIREDILSISGVRRSLSPMEKFVSHQLEIPEGAFLRRIRLTIPVKRDDIGAKLENGILKIDIPKE